MKNLYRKFLNFFDGDALLKRTFELGAIEKGQTTPSHIRAAELVFEELKKAGIPNVEKIDIPADGKSTFQDKTTPLAWDATIGRLTILNEEKEKWVPVNLHSTKKENKNLLADFQEHPFHLVKGSVATAPGGIEARVITTKQLLTGEDPRGALVVLEPLCRAGAKVLKPMLQMGALGFITDFMIGRYETPDALQWVNAATCSGNWHVTAEDPDFIGFCVTPRTGDLIRHRANTTGLKVKVECDGRRYSGVEPMVTALIPGESKKEFWILAHLYEPLLNDNSSGVSIAIEIARALMQEKKLRHSVRLVFAMEMYGFAAYAAMRGETLKDEVIGGCNLDGIPAADGEFLTLYPTGNAKPFIGNKILKDIYETFKDELNLKFGTPTYMDDLFLGDPSVGVPGVWLLGDSKGYWHNSAQCDPDFIDKDTMCRSAAFAATYIKSVVDSEEEPQPSAPVPGRRDTPWRDYASKMILDRKEAGFLYSLAKIPPAERIPIPDGMIYGPFAHVVAALDGKKDLSSAISTAEAETGKTLSEANVKKYIDALNCFTDYGYFEALRRPEITKEDICAALQRLGVSNDDLLLVHASVSKCGYISGGAKTIIDSIRSSVDTVAFTTFTRPYIFLGAPNGNWSYRPFDPADADAVWTGTVGKTLLRNYPDVHRSRHITHSWAGFGSRIHQLLDAHGPCEPPAGENSPPGKALALGGKILFFGAGLESTTFIHYLEDASRMPFLETAICRVKRQDGSLESVAIERHLPGDREFYKNAMESKFFQRAFQRGLKLKRTPLGMGEVLLLDTKELFDIGMALLKEDPKVLLCDREDCSFCAKYR